MDHTLQHLSLDTETRRNLLDYPPYSYPKSNYLALQ